MPFDLSFPFGNTTGAKLYVNIEAIAIYNEKCGQFVDTVLAKYNTLDATLTEIKDTGELQGNYFDSFVGKYEDFQIVFAHAMNQVIALNGNMAVLKSHAMQLMQARDALKENL